MYKEYRNADANAYLPFISISHDNLATLSIVLVNSHLFHIFRTFNAENFVNFIFLKRHKCQINHEQSNKYRGAKNSA